MKHLRSIVAAVAVPVIILTLFAVSSVFAGPPQGKADLCHSAGGHKFVQISVSTNAVPAHMAHGDVAVDEYGECP